MVDFTDGQIRSAVLLAARIPPTAISFKRAAAVLALIKVNTRKIFAPRDHDKDKEWVTLATRVSREA